MQHDAPLHLSVRRIVIDGALLGAAFSFLVIGSLWIDARLWLQDYPPDIRAAVGEDVVAPLALTAAVGLFFLVILLGGLIMSNRRLWMEAPALYGWKTAFTHTLILFWLVNVVDVLLIDWLFLVTLRPDFVVFPGTEGMAGYGDYLFHARASFGSWQPWLASLLLAATVAIVAPRWWGSRSTTPR